jgi:SAM-dependent methyltransferase
MTASYSDIFAQRGREYHEAMCAWPHACRLEFEAILAVARPIPGETVVDLPAAGSYFQDWLDVSPLRFIAIDPSPVFHEFSRRRVAESYLSPMEALPLPAGSVDLVMSQAGLHHAPDWLAIFREVCRVLRPGGRFAIGEVEEGSDVARFLNEFVDEHNPQGHAGQFVGESFRQSLQAAGFSIREDKAASYAWCLPSRADLAKFLGLLFGLRDASEAQILEGAERYLGVVANPDDSIDLAWSLRIMLAIKEV